MNWRPFKTGFAAVLGVGAGLFTVGVIAGAINELIHGSNSKAVKDAEQIVNDWYRRWFE